MAKATQTHEAATDSTLDFLDNTPVNGVLSPAQVEAQEALDGSVTLDFRSKEDSKSGNFLPLEENIYVLTVESAKVTQRPTFNDKSKMEAAINLTFLVVSNLSKTPIKDIKGAEQADGKRKFWETLSTTSLGFKKNGEPAKTRACICALLGQDSSEALTGINTETLWGKSCKVMLGLGQKMDGTAKNVAVKYSAI